MGESLPVSRAFGGPAGAALLEWTCCPRNAMTDAPPPPKPEPGPPAQASLREVVFAVFWSFFGVRKGNAMRRDAAVIRPYQVVIVGVVLAAVLVVSLLLLVRLILRAAGA